jgi:hypothetical protein
MTARTEDNVGLFRLFQSVLVDVVENFLLPLDLNLRVLSVTE